MSRDTARPAGAAPRTAHTRRTFVKGLAAAGVVASSGVSSRVGAAARDERQPQRVLTGTEFDLAIGETTLNITGRDRRGLTINGSLPGPVLRWREGDAVTLRVRNDTRDEDTSIHWHGILLPANMDGVPGLSFGGIKPGESYTYQFTVKQNGTYWYHSHSAFQEQVGVYGPLIIDPREPEPFAYEREHVVMLTDWTDEQPERVFAKVKKQSDYYNFRQRTVFDFFRDVRRRGWKTAVNDWEMWGQMRMNPTDLADITGYAYTYLMNGVPPAGNWTGLFERGERVRLRFINGAAQTYFDVRIPGLKMTVVAADGLPVHPVQVDEFRIAVAETYDVIVEPSQDMDAYTIFAQSMDRTDFAAGTLAIRAGMRAAIPTPDPRQLLTMTDMGHGGMAGHDMSSMGQAPQQGDGASAHAGHAMGTPAAPPAAAADPHAGHGQTATPAPAAPATDPHAGHTMPGQGPQPPGKVGLPEAHDMSTMSGAMQTHPATEEGSPLVDMQAMTPEPRLSDPGVGRRDNGRKVLTYADLRSTFDDPDGREPSRTIELHLTGHMEKFAWSFDGVKFSSAEPVRLKYGERIRLVLVNDSMMSHPIHLHGMWSDLEDEAGNFLVRKHTIDMPPGTRRSYRVRADALGRWAYHCHLLYHMEAGMFREVRVEE